MEKALSQDLPRFDATEADFNPDEFLRNVAVDNVIFGYHERELKVLLQRPIIFKKWTITGGYVKKIESLEQAASRVAWMRTGLNNLFLQQFHCFGNLDRTKDQDFTPELESKLVGVNDSANLFIFDRSVSIGFYTLTEFSLVKTSKSPYDEEIKWWPIDHLPKLMFDHKEIIQEALNALQIHIHHFPIGFELLPEKFTLPEIHSLYETILGKSLHFANFGRKLMSTGILKKLDETKSIGAHRSPFLYKFDKKKYAAALKNRIFLAF